VPAIGRSFTWLEPRAFYANAYRNQDFLPNP
jgi:hypothetical protein